MPLIWATREPLKHRNQQNTKYLHNTFQKTKQSNIAQIEPCDATWLGQVVFQIAHSTSVSGTNLIKLKHSGQLHGALYAVSQKHLRKRTGASTRCLGMRLPNVKRQ